MRYICARRVRRPVLFGMGSFGILCGLAVSAAGIKTGLFAIGLALLLLLTCFGRRAAIALPAVLAAGVLVGVWRGGEAQQSLARYQYFIDQKVVVTGAVSEDPKFDDKNQLDLRLTDVRIGGVGLPGEVRVKTLAPLSPKRGDIIKAKGKLRNGFGNYQASLYYADVTIMSHNINLLDRARHHFAAAVYNTIPEPQASLGLGFLLGITASLPDDLSNQLRILGLTHIVVASGYNLTILIRLAKRLCEPRSAYQTVVVAGCLIVAFVCVSGVSPSMCRAALVAGVALLAWYYGRAIHPLVLLLFAAAVTAALNPLFIWFDIGWWLSFLAFAGIMLLAPLVQQRIFSDKQPKLLGQLFIETTTAHVATLPLILWIFGDLPVWSVLANLLIAPLVPLTMLCTFIAGSAYILTGPLLAYVAMPATWLLTFMTDMVAIMAAWPWATVPFKIDLPIMLGMYAALVGGGVVLWRRTKYDYLSSSIID